MSLTRPLSCQVLGEKKVKSESGIPLNEWRKQLAMLPEEVVENTLENSTPFYLRIKAENRQDP
eukprot:7285657-Ditylum_brightwellii.AAC.1